METKRTESEIQKKRKFLSTLGLGTLATAFIALVPFKRNSFITNAKPQKQRVSIHPYAVKRGRKDN